MTEPTPQTTFFPASPEAVAKLLAMPVSDNTRSEFLWVWTAEGDLLCGFFPRADGYEEMETYFTEDFQQAKRAGNVTYALGEES